MQNFTLKIFNYTGYFVKFVVAYENFKYMVFFLWHLVKENIFDETWVFDENIIIDYYHSLFSRNCKFEFSLNIKNLKDRKIFEYLCGI